MGRRFSPRQLLESILLPSQVITEGYATTEIETKSGEVITGRIEREDARTVVIRPPAATEEVATIRKSDIVHRALTKTSNMPAGIINSLGETQILDLMAYLISESNPDHAAFRPSTGSAPTGK